MHIWQSVWNWIDRDLYDSRPLSSALFVVPFIPAAIAQAIGAPPKIEAGLLLLALPVGFAWIGYVFYRRFKHAGRAMRLTMRRAKKEHVGSICPVCLTELVDPPEAERYKFGGWICPGCDTELDRYAREIHY